MTINAHITERCFNLINYSVIITPQVGTSMVDPNLTWLVLNGDDFYAVHEVD